MSLLTNEKQQYQKEQDKLLKTILDLRYFNPWRGLTKYNDDRSLQNDAELEIFITSTCNQKCEYCYLYNNEKLYPKEYNKPELILKNLRILYDYILMNNFHIPVIDFFTGEIWHSKFGLDILEITLEYLKKGMQIGYIIITSNCFFVAKDETLQPMQQYINKFNEINCPIQVSISVDGKIMDDESRPRNNNSDIYSDEFYNRLFAFAKINNYLFHPMVSAHNIHKWIENYTWWEEMNKYYGFSNDNLMLLEVRNDGWTDENIKDYCAFMDFLMEKYLKEECNNNIELFGNALTGGRHKGNDPRMNGYIPWCIGPVDTFHGCTISKEMVVRLGDLAICPCHRTAYEEYLYGKFIVENDQIVDIKAINPEMAIKILMSNILTSDPLCDQCKLNDVCLHGCLGSQLETMKDPFFPIPNICKFFHEKYKSILRFYKEHGIIDYLKTYSLGEPGGVRAAIILQTYDKFEEEL